MGLLEQIHRDNNAFEHAYGVINNNIIMNCANDVGVYLNKAAKSSIVNNTLYNSVGIDVRFKESSAIINRNVISGRIAKRNDGEIIESQNNIVLPLKWLTADDGLNDYFYAPANGDFTWINSATSSNKTELEKQSVGLPEKDFCLKVNIEPYIGAFAERAFW